MKSVYYVALLLGLALVVYICGVQFDSLSEDELVNCTPLWLVPLAFGIYGLAAEKAVSLIDAGKGPRLAAVARVIARLTWFVGLVPLIPFLFLRARSSLRTAAAACVFWIAVYLVITQCVWHLL